jgi:EpsI family protein
MIALGLATAALAANHLVAPLPTAVLRRLPVESLPQRIGAWRCVADRATDPAVQKVVPTARIVDRVYREEGTGREVTLTLLTATDYADFHDPNICFPGQGFTLSAAEPAMLAGQALRVMTAERGGERLRVAYWWSGSAAPDTTYGREQVGKLLALRDRLTGRQGRSLFVRVIAAEPRIGSEQAAQRQIEDFARTVSPALAELEAGGMQQDQAGATPSSPDSEGK